MKRAIRMVLLAAWGLNGSFSAGQAASVKADFYVAPDGSDEGEGTLSSPFATLERARDAVRERKKTKKGDITVLIRGGTYRLDKTVVFGLEDSGGDGQTITYAAWPGEMPVFSAGREIKGWKKVSRKLSDLSPKARNRVYVADVRGCFFTLYDKDGLLPRARSAGFIPLEGGSKNEVHFPKGRMKNWSNLEDVEIVIRPTHAWIVNVLPLASVDEKTQIARTAVDATYAMNGLHFIHGEESCWVENILEALDEPGEWVLNTKEGKLYLWPRGRSPVFMPTLLELIRVEGKIDKRGPTDMPARNLRFRGLTFMHGERYQVLPDDAGLQHDWDMHDKANALVRLRGTENCTIENCHFLYSGSDAIRVDLYGIGNTISGNHIEHVGGGGILLCGYGPGTKDVNRKNLVTNNHIHHVGEIYRHSPGIFLWQSGENRVSNNLIHHTPYTGIIISGCMSQFFAKPDGRELVRTIRRHEVDRLPARPKPEDVLPYLHTHDNLIEYNEIHHVMEKLGDGNGIYVRGAGANNVIRRNYIHDLVAPTKMQSAIRTDGGQHDTLIAENLIYRCTSCGIKLKLNNRAENNIIADLIQPIHKGRAGSAYAIALREGPMTGAAIKKNIFYQSSGEFVRFYDEDTKGSRGRKVALIKDVDCDYNIYWSRADRDLGNKTLSRLRRNGTDIHSRAVDPLFVDPKNGDFRFKSDSPALKMGIHPINLSHVGLRRK